LFENVLIGEEKEPNEDLLQDQSIDETASIDKDNK